jgi:hypothetical protein
MGLFGRISNSLFMEWNGAADKRSPATKRPPSSSAPSTPNIIVMSCAAFRPLNPASKLLCELAVPPAWAGEILLASISREG